MTDQQVALVLTFSTGIVDAVGYLGLDRVFTGNMTGNVVVLGMGLAGADRLPVFGPVLALAGFVMGAAAAGRVLMGQDKGWRPCTPLLLACVSAVLIGLTVTLALAGHPARPLALVVTGVLGLAMGTQAGTARHLAVPDVSTVVVTSTLTGLAADSWSGSVTRPHAVRRAAAVVLILAGASVGALLLRWQSWPPLALAALITSVVTITSVRR